MSLLFDGGSGSFLSRTASLPSFTNWSICFWFKVIGNTATAEVIFTRGHATAGRSVDVYWDGGLSPARMVVASSDAGSASTGTPIPLGTWHHCAVTKRGTVARMYINARPEAFNPVTLNSDNATGDVMYVGVYNDGAALGFWGPIAHFKQWDNAVLSIDEIKAEMYSVVPQRTDNLYHWTPFRGSGRDMSGRARNWTETSIVRSADEPPGVVWDRAKLGITPFRAGAAVADTSFPPTPTPAINSYLVR